MGSAEGEVDYLAGAQLETDPESFAECVSEAFLLEHDCIERQDIADTLGVHKSRVSQILGQPEKLKAETVKNLIGHLKSEKHRHRIVRAWVKESLGIEVEKRPRGRLTSGKVNEKTVRRVDRQIRQSRLGVAAATASEAAALSTDLILREQLLDRAYFTRLRLNLPGRAMEVVRQIAEGARDRSDPGRLAAAHHFRARILLALPDARPDHIDPVFARIESLLESPGSQLSLPYYVPSHSSLARLKASAFVKFVESGVLEASPDALKLRLRESTETIRRSSTYQEKFHCHLVAARLCLLLGETFAAQEHVDAAFKSGKLKNLNSLEMCGLLEAKILARTEPAQQVIQMLRKVSDNCLKTLDLQHRQQAEEEIARLESSLITEL